LLQNADVYLGLMIKPGKQVFPSQAVCPGDTCFPGFFYSMNDQDNLLRQLVMGPCQWMRRS